MLLADYLKQHGQRPIGELALCGAQETMLTPFTEVVSAADQRLQKPRHFLYQSKPAAQGSLEELLRYAEIRFISATLQEEQQYWEEVLRHACLEEKSFSSLTPNLGVACRLAIRAEITLGQILVADRTPETQKGLFWGFATEILTEKNETLFLSTKKRLLEIAAQRGWASSADRFVKALHFFRFQVAVIKKPSHEKAEEVANSLFGGATLLSGDC